MGDLVGFGVLTAVQFYDEHVSEAGEVWIISKQRRLPAEVVTICTQIAKLYPEPHFLRCHRFAKFTRPFDRHLPHPAARGLPIR